MNELEEGKTYKTASCDTAEIFKIIDGVAYGRISDEQTKVGWCAYVWSKEGLNILGDADEFNIVFDEEPEFEPSWHQYVADGYAVLCEFWDRDEDKLKPEKGLLTAIKVESRRIYQLYIAIDPVLYLNAKPITTQCGKYITGIKDGKTVLLFKDYNERQKLIEEAISSLIHLKKMDEIAEANRIRRYKQKEQNNKVAF